MTPTPGKSLDQPGAERMAGKTDPSEPNAQPAAPGLQAAGGGALAHGQDATAVGARGVAIEGGNAGDINTGQQLVATHGARIVIAERGATVVMGDAPVPMSAVERESALGRYLQHLISQHRYLQLQGIRSRGNMVNIELDRIYVTLRTRGQRAGQEWLAAEMALAPGERVRGRIEAPGAETDSMTVNDALAAHRRMVVLGDPGSGKTTLLRYLALLFARDLAEGTREVGEKLGLAEAGVLPMFLALRQFGRYMTEHHRQEDGTEGHAFLLHFFTRALANERIEVPADFFDAWLTGGRAVILLDGLDEVADPALRQRVARLVDAFTRAYPDCRYVVTSRIVGYTEATQLAEGYVTSTVRDFSIDDVNAFLTRWHRLVAISLMGPGEAAEAFGAEQTRQLTHSIDANQRVRELAINPLMLSVIALIHRDRVKLPDRRAELYQEAVDVLLGKWDDARGIADALVVGDRVLDVSERRLVLQAVALAMQEQRIKEIDAEPLGALLAAQLADAVPDARERAAAVARFLGVIQERSGLLIARAEGTYAFSHLTFQEYLAALQIAGRDDYVEYTVNRAGDHWWREVILLEAGHLSTQSRERTTRLIAAIADAGRENVLHHNLVLAAECVRDAGAGRIIGNLEVELRNRLKRELEPPQGAGWLGAVTALFSRGNNPAVATRRRIAAAEALDKIGGNRFWSPPHGEPEWVFIPEGEFTMGEDSEAHRVLLPDYSIARVPVTNAQYQRFVQASECERPDGWNGRQAPRGREGHPVTGVNWHDALAYCRWLSAMTGKPIALPSEAEWEKAARGANDARTYPWGDDFDAARCNVEECGFGDTTPVGIFTGGTSPGGCFDMAGNVWEWTRSVWGKDREKSSFAYPYDPNDRHRENPDAGANMMRVVRGGSWCDPRDFARCAFRLRYRPGLRVSRLGFRVVWRSSPES